MQTPPYRRRATRACLGLLVLLGSTLAHGDTPTVGTQTLPEKISNFAGGVGDGGPATQGSLRFAYGVAADTMGNVLIADSAHHRVRQVNPQGVISSVAGRDGYGYYGDGGLATDAQLYTPYGVAVDKNGNVFIADTVNNRIREVATTGIISTIAGNGKAGFAGDGGQATAAELNMPVDLSVDSNGTVFVSDLGNSRIRMIAPDGTITTVAGNGKPRFAGDGGRAERASINWAWGIDALNDGTLYIADTGNHRIRKVSPNGIISTVVGNGKQGFNGDGRSGGQTSLYYPWGVTTDATGNLYVADLGNNRIRKLSAGRISTIAGGGAAGFSGDGGTANHARLSLPSDVVFDSNGALIISDALNYRVRRVTPNGIISTIAGNGVASPVGDGGLATSSALNFPQDLEFDRQGRLYIADAGNFRVRRINMDGTMTTVAGRGSRGVRGDGGLAVLAELGSPRGLAFDRAGNLYIADTQYHRIRKVNTHGFISTVAGTGYPGFSGDGGKATRAKIQSPGGLACDAAGNLYIADTANHRIRRVDRHGIITTVVGTGTKAYFGDGGPARVAGITFPRDVAFGPDGSMFIADTGNSVIRRVSPDGVITTFAGNTQRGSRGDGGPATLAQLNAPAGVSIGRDGTVYIADFANNKIRMVNTSGLITTIAGNGQRGRIGDGLPAFAAELSLPYTAVPDASGNVFIADTYNFRIRRIDAVPAATAPAS